MYEHDYVNDDAPYLVAVTIPELGDCLEQHQERPEIFHARKDMAAALCVPIEKKFCALVEKITLTAIP
jgi:hypothetical protein